MALGSDTGGSIRGPASLCGLAGLMPTFGLVGRGGVLPNSYTFDHCGPLACSVEDCAIVLQAIAGFDPRDAGSLKRDIPEYRAALHQDLKGLRIGITAPNSSSHFFVLYLMAKAGLASTDASFVGVGGGERAVNAIVSGEIDAISNLDPVITQLESTGKFVAVADSRTEKGMRDIYGGDYHASVIYITDEFIKKNPNTVQAVVNAMVRADRWIAKASSWPATRATSRAPAISWPKPRVI